MHLLLRSDTSGSRFTVRPPESCLTTGNGERHDHGRAVAVRTTVPLPFLHSPFPPSPSGGDQNLWVGNGSGSEDPPSERQQLGNDNGERDTHD